MPTINGKFYPGIDADVMHRFIHWCSDKGVPAKTLASLSRMCSEYLEDRPGLEAAGKDSSPSMPHAPPIRLSDEVWDDLPNGPPKPIGEP